MTCGRFVAKCVTQGMWRRYFALILRIGEMAAATIDSVVRSVITDNTEMAEGCAADAAGCSAVTVCCSPKADSKDAPAVSMASTGKLLNTWYGLPLRTDLLCT